MSTDIRDMNSEEYIKLAEDVGIHYMTKDENKWLETLGTTFGEVDNNSQPTEIDLCGNLKEPICNLIDATPLVLNPRQEEAMKKILELFKYELYEPLGNKVVELMIYEISKFDSRDWTISIDAERDRIDVNKDIESLV